MKIWFGLVEAFKSYRGNKKKKKTKKKQTQLNLISLRNIHSVGIEKKTAKYFHHLTDDGNILL